MEPYKEPYKKIEPPASQDTSQGAKDELQAAEKTAKTAPPAAAPPQPKPKRNIFFRFLEGLSSFLRRLF